MANSEIKSIGVFTSGGDSPGMNACLRAVVRTAVYNKLRVFGIRRGYQGMIENDIEELNSSSVGNILQRGGTILRSARSMQFFEYEYRKTANDNLKAHGIDGLVAIGGDGTFTGAKVFHEDFGVPTIGVPGTIDNDLYGTDNTIGFDTALNTVVDAIDKIRDTADSHNRLFFIEVMGRDAGFIALRAGIAGGAESILVPETETDIQSLIQSLERGWRRKKNYGIVIVAEGDDAGGAMEIANKVKEKFTNYDIRVSILGHMQRGGSPSCKDRVLASSLGYQAVMALLDGKTNMMVGEVNNKVAFTPFGKAIKHHASISKDLLRLNEVLTS